MEIPAHREAMLDLVDIQSKFQKRKASLFAHKHKRPVQEDTVPIIQEDDKPHLTVDNVPVNSKEEPADTVQDAKKDLEVDYHAIPLETLLDRLETDESFGLTSSKASEKLKRDGPNTIKVGNRFAGLFKIIGYLFGGFGIIMWPAAIMAVLSYRPLGDPDPDIANLGLAIVLFSVIFISAFFSGWQDWQSSKVMNTIGKMLPAEAQVTRDGVTSMIPVANLVAGDIIVVQNGTRVPADVRIVNHSQIKVDNSILTGESEPIACTVACTNEENFMETKNLLFMGTSIVEGSCVGVVVATGNETMMGKIAKMATRSAAMTPIQKEIYIFMLIICGAAFITALAIILTWAFWLRVQKPTFLLVGPMVALVIGVIVAYMPNGLPVSVSLTFTVMARRMFEHNVLVKMLPTVETLGSIDTIASDKTGTLTQNKMSVLHIVSAMRTVEMEECRRLHDNGDHSIREVVRISALCNRAIYDQSTIDFPPIQRKVIGDASDTGILLFAEEFCKATQVRESYEKLLEIPFNSKNKWMLNIWNIDNQPVLLMKGAAEIIMNKCTTMLMEDGTEIVLNDEMRQRLSQIQEELAANGERVLGLARQDLVNFTVNSHFDADAMNFPIEGHCFVGLVALIDPPRVDVLDAVQKCQKASIRVMMVTGDHPATATAISRMVGIVTKDKVIQVTGNDTLADTDTLEEIKSRALAITGHLIPDFDQTTWDNIFKHDEIVWARTTPDHKLTIVMECQRRKHVVAVTGDGVNDAPALKQANVGVAMGAGSEVAREAADIVLTDSKFSSIVVGIENGRMAFDNMKKVILYLIPAGTFAELLPILAYVFFGVPQMLSSFLMICVCVGTDIFPSLAMIYEPAEADLMDRMPRSKTGEKLVNLRLLLHAFFFTGLYEAFASFTMFFCFMYFESDKRIRIQDLIFCFDHWNRDGYRGFSRYQLQELLYQGQTVYFATLVICQIGNLLATRTRRLSIFQQNPFGAKTGNKFLGGAAVVSLLIAIMVAHLPILQSIFNTRQIPVQYWFIPIAWSLGLLVLDELRKVVVRLLPHWISRRIFW